MDWSWLGEVREHTVCSLSPSIGFEFFLQLLQAWLRCSLMTMMLRMEESPGRCGGNRRLTNIGPRPSWRPDTASPNMEHNLPWTPGTQEPCCWRCGTPQQGWGATVILTATEVDQRFSIQTEHILHQHCQVLHNNFVKGAGTFHWGSQSKGGNFVLTLLSIRLTQNFYQIISGTK